MSAVWEAGSFEVITTDGLVEVAGWLWNGFALDFRVWAETGFARDVPVRGWTLTHLPSQRSVCGLLMPLASAKEVVAKLAELGDWNNAEKDEALKASALEFIKSLEETATRETPWAAPLFTSDAIAKVSA